jgi:ADP-ribose pyrophosphatase YjhB (NUDIX family)
VSEAAADGSDGAPPAAAAAEAASDWLRWSRTLRAVAQAGLTYAATPFDRQRFETVRTVAAELAAAGSGLAASGLGELFAAGAGHPTPKVDVRGAVFDADGRILLVLEREDGGWTLPGGWADVGDAPSETVEREVREESGVPVRAERLVAVLDRDRHGHTPHVDHIYKLFFLCRALDGPRGEPDAEVEAIGWFDPADPPPLSLARVTPAQLELMAAHAADPSLPTVFD